ncbi:Hypothetical_protein [Hexamita inflata]|uniref:Hypothetical_protein n=1 Tax=Hexamita inflata TaxID=28002 RepID=A0AA86RA39_9EUKA|nr:Hypothetical protein HINF_LOCUS56663 [Hexamita inflata]CAI9969022.1 Hypothetical protein HINF_LOCUS56667 [Hexamita inflata]
MQVWLYILLSYLIYSLVCGCCSQCNYTRECNAARLQLILANFVLQIQISTECNLVQISKLQWLSSTSCFDDKQSKRNMNLSQDNTLRRAAVNFVVDLPLRLGDHDLRNPLQIFLSELRQKILQKLFFVERPSFSLVYVELASVQTYLVVNCVDVLQQQDVDLENISDWVETHSEVGSQQTNRCDNDRRRQILIYKNLYPTDGKRFRYFELQILLQLERLQSIFSLGHVQQI